MPYRVGKLLLFLWILINIVKSADGQVASFSVPDTVCINTPFPINNTSTGASSYYWNFCLADVNAAPQASALGNPGGNLSLPCYMDYVSQNGNYYAFVINNSPGGLVRLDFGNSLLNTPVSVNLGNFGGIISNSAQGIQLVQNSGRWYAIIVCGDPATIPATPSRILKVDFGANLNNPSPVATNWGNIGNMNYPHDLYLFQDQSNNWHGLTVNYRSSTVTKFSFGSDFNNAPTGVNLGNVGNLNGPTGICPVNDNGLWRIFVTSFNNHTLSRIDFGNSLLNTPSGAVNLGNPGNLFNNPRDLYIFNYCGQSVGFAINNNATLSRLNFSTLSSAPAAVSLGNTGGAVNISTMSKVFRVQDDLFVFLSGFNPSNLIRLKFPGCSNASLPNSTAAAPGNISYSAPGVYSINLTIDEGLPTQRTTCRQVVVRDKISLSKSIDPTICSGSSVQLTVSGATQYQWSPAAGLSNDRIANPVASPTSSTKYYVDASVGGCPARDSIVVTVLPRPSFGLTPAAPAICLGDSVQLTAIGGDSYNWLVTTGLSDPLSASTFAKPSVSTQYAVRIASSGVCNTVDTLYTTVSLKPSPSIVVSKSGDINCSTPQVQLTVSGNAVQYRWTPSTGLSAPNIANPTVQVIQSTFYTLTATGANGCSASDSITVMVNNSGISATDFLVPSAFTPNGDGINDCFGIRKWGAVNNLEFSVLNRWGQVIFFTRNASTCWDGLFQRIQQPAGTYVYLIKAETTCGSVLRKGTVTLIR